MSGLSNVRHYLAVRGLANTPELEKALLETAKSSDHVLTEEEILDLCRTFSSAP